MDTIVASMAMDDGALMTRHRTLPYRLAKQKTETSTFIRRGCGARFSSLWLFTFEFLG
jgi:hypothetical protein